MTDQIAALSAVLAGRYRVIRELGAGGMATVYLADDDKHRRQVAIKLLRPELAASVGADRFLREIEIAARLQHPHILPLYDSGGEGGVLYYVMPFVEGQSLRDRMTKTGALPIADAVRIVREIADALAYSHQRGVVHRDIKPENILISGAHALVTDFGIAKAISDAGNATQLTSAGMAMGTPSYMAPEQIMADPALDHRVDIYAVGVMAYELIAGRTPFSGANAQQIIAAHLTRTPDPLSMYRDTISPALEAVVMRCLAKNPADRWQSAEELRSALVGAVTGATAALSASDGHANRRSAGPATAGNGSRTAGGVSSGKSGGPPPARGRRTAMIVSAAAGVALAVGGVVWFGKDGRAGTLIGNAVLAANDLVLVSEFQNHTADSTLASTVTDAVRVELQQSRVVKVMSQAAMWAGIVRMGLTKDAALEEAKVQELAEREGAKAYVVGDIARLGGGYQLTARVLATGGGSEALTAKATAADDSKLIGAVEELGRTIRKGIGESLRSVSNAPPLAQVTTASLPALRLFTAGRRAVNSGESLRAITLAKQALALDTSFASAWNLLYVAYANTGAVQSQLDAINHAYALRSRMSEFEALATTARYHRLHGDFAEEETAWQRLVEVGREHANYANMLLDRRRPAEAEAVQRRGIDADSNLAIGYWNLTEAQVAQRKFAAAESTVARMAARLPDARLTQQAIVGIPLGKRDFTAAAALLTTAGGAKLVSVMPQYQCIIDLARGRVRAAARCESGRPVLTQFAALGEYRLTGDTVRARVGYASFLAAKPEDRSRDLYAVTIALLADVGKVREAKQLLDEWRTRVTSAGPSFRADSAYAVGSIAAAEGQWDKAATAFLTWNASPMPSSFHWFNRGLAEAATALARLGNADSSRVLMERALDSPSLALGWVYETTWYAQALQQLGDSYDARGDRAKAASYYQKYVELLKDADEPVAAQVKVVMDKLVRVTGEPAPAAVKVGKP